MFCMTLIAVAYLAYVEGLYGGSRSSIFDYPYQAAVLRRNWDIAQFRYACSGAIVSQTFILTVASCSGDSYKNLGVRVGSSYHQSGGDLHRVRDVYRHPNFTADLDSDLALLRLADSLRLSARVAVVKLPRQDELAGGKQATISLWEFDSEEELQVNPNVYILYSKQCKESYNKYLPNKDLITDNMICIYDYIYSPCCEREQGGPLVLAGTLHGLSSWSYRCGTNAYPSVFTRVSAFTMWIDSILKS